VAQEEERNRVRAAESEQARLQIESGVPTEQVRADLVSKGLSRWEAVLLVRAIRDEKVSGGEGALSEQGGGDEQDGQAEYMSLGFVSALCLLGLGSGAIGAGVWWVLFSEAVPDAGMGGASAGEWFDVVAMGFLATSLSVVSVPLLLFGLLGAVGLVIGLVFGEWDS